MFEALRDVEYVAKVAVDPELGTVAWPNPVVVGADPVTSITVLAARMSPEPRTPNR